MKRLNKRERRVRSKGQAFSIIRDERTHREIAKAHGISRATVYKIKRGIHPYGSFKEEFDIESKKKNPNFLEDEEFYPYTEKASYRKFRGVLYIWSDDIEIAIYLKTGGFKHLKIGYSSIPLAKRLPYPEAIKLIRSWREKRQ